ncbi:MAG: SUMF1/EgtB/PvdO family nonheme iron enzyme [Planctomycetota bacterium]|nr:SUMF1/EgtB/PvdO family nonheme iron enzyme [Planctomycetota bacterium]
MKIEVPVAGVQDLFLLVTGVPHVVGGAATWADAVLVASDGKTVIASRGSGREVLKGRCAFDVNLKSGVSGPLKIAGQVFEHGLHVYADSQVRIPLGGKFERFEASIGIDDWVGRRGAVRFDVTDAAGAARADLWDLLERDFTAAEPRRQMRWEREDRLWDTNVVPGDFAALARRYVDASSRVPAVAREAAALAANVRDAAGLQQVRQRYYATRQVGEALARARQIRGAAPSQDPGDLAFSNFASLRLAITDLQETFGETYAGGAEYLARLEALQKDFPTDRGVPCVAEFDRLQHEALLANPLLDFQRLLLIRRQPHGDPRRQEGTGYGVGEYIGLPRQSSKCNPGIEEPFNWDNEIAVLQPVRPDGQLTTLYKPDGHRLITDLDLHWDANRLLFSMPGSLKMWQIFELGADGQGLRQVTPGEQPEVHSYDSCYLPNGKIAFISTAPLQGVPCNAGVIVGMLYSMDADGKNIRQICFEQDHDHCPVVLNNGRLLYLRWDYTDTPHVWNRILFSMNPDGTDQMEFYGANSYWPNAIFYARPIPHQPTKIVGIVTGHHVGRVGELVVFDPALGRREADGVVQRIPGRGQQVEPVIEDKLTEHSWPKFLHPYPLSDKYFIVSCKPTPDALWGLYLVDVFDNLVLLKEEEGQALLEPLPLRPQPKPPIIQDRVEPDRTDAAVYMADVYQGPGIQGIPRGTVKSLRVFSYHFGYQRIAGIDHRVGTDGPWEVKRILGTVPVEADGSAYFRVPAKTPLSVQPLDAEGKAVALMRSWMTAQPGETLSCVGCHDHRSTAPPNSATLAMRRPPRQIQPWYGPPRNFCFRNEVQPVLDKFCVGCHDGAVRDDAGRLAGPGLPLGQAGESSAKPGPSRRKGEAPAASGPSRREGEAPAEPGTSRTAPGRALLDLRGEQGATLCYRAGDPKLQRIVGQPVEKLVGRYGGIFEPSYIALRSLVRVPGLESDLHLLPPTEFHADNSELIQMLKQGHQGVQLDAEAWDRLITWIDLNAPSHGTWSEFTRIPDNQRQRRCELRQLYGGVVEDGEEAAPVAPAVGYTAPVPLPVPATRAASPTVPGWPFDAAEAARRQAADGPPTRTVVLGGMTVELVRIPAGRLVLGDPDGEGDERPLTAVEIDKPFWMSRCEVTNSQFARFNPAHQSRYEHRGSWIFGEEYLGYPLDGPQQPVVRISWHEATGFCRWLSERTGLAFRLPTEAQWEWACRAGTDTAFHFGRREADFSPFANLADATIRELAYQSWSPRTPDIVPRDERYNDHALVSVAVGSYQPNAWGLCDLHGNVAEWTRTAYRPYPYREDDGRNAADAGGSKVVRGGSWRDRPARCRSAMRLSYPPYQRVFNVGFRVVCETPEAGKVAATEKATTEDVTATASTTHTKLHPRPGTPGRGPG